LNENHSIGDIEVYGLSVDFLAEVSTDRHLTRFRASDRGARSVTVAQSLRRKGQSCSVMHISWAASA
jgi:hypothetical protein